MHLQNAAGQKIVPGLDIYCSERQMVGQIIGIQPLMKRCLVQLRNGALIYVNATDVVIAGWSQIGSKVRAAQLNAQQETATKQIAPQAAA
jgi:hypothetical protein